MQTKQEPWEIIFQNTENKLQAGEKSKWILIRPKS